MNKNELRVYLAISASVFAVVALLHLWRAVQQWDVVVGVIDVPIALSWIGCVVAGCLSAWAWRLYAGD